MNNTVIDSVTINNTKNNGIFIEETGAAYVAANTVTNCRISNAWACGIQVSGNYSIIKDNIIANCGLHGVNLTAPAGLRSNANKIEGNQVNGCGQYGFVVDAQAAGSTMLYNMLSNNYVGQCNMASATPTWAGFCLAGSGSGGSSTQQNTSLLGNYVWTASAPNTLYGLFVWPAGVNNAKAIGNDFAFSGTSYDMKGPVNSSYPNTFVNLGTWHI